MNTEVMFSSKSDEWTTPLDFFKKLNDIFHFTLDPAATPENALCKKFYTYEDDGLIQNWYGEITFLNPPYGRGIAKWMKKCADQRELAEIIQESSPCPGREKRSLIVALIPSRTDTKWMHRYVYGVADWIVDIKGRLKFDNPTMDWDKPTSAPFPSRLAIYGYALDKELYKLAKLGQIIKPVTLVKDERGYIRCLELS